MDLDAILGIDQSDPRDRLADYLVSCDEQLIADLVARRHELRLSQDDVGRRMGIDKSYVSRIERGDRDLLQSTLRRYAMALDAVVAHEVQAFEDVDGAHRARRFYAGSTYQSSAATGTPYRTAPPVDYRERVLVATNG